MNAPTLNALTHLRRLAAGHRPDGELLPPARLQAFGVEFIGEEAIVHSFRQAPLVLASDADVIAANGHLAVFDGASVLFADLYGEDIARLWRLGPGEPGSAEPFIGVPFDPDLWQARRDVALRAADHPALSSEGVDAVAAIGRDLARRWPLNGGRASSADGASHPLGASEAADYRVRPFVLRAFSVGADAADAAAGDGQGAALFAVYRLGPAAERTAGFTLAAAHFHVSGGQLAGYTLVRDVAGEAALAAAPWQPRVSP